MQRLNVKKHPEPRTPASMHGGGDWRATPDNPLRLSVCHSIDMTSNTPLVPAIMRRQHTGLEISTVPLTETDVATSMPPPYLCDQLVLLLSLKRPSQTGNRCIILKLREAVGPSC